MPTYEYSCEKCGRTFEFFQSMKDAPLKTCPEDLCQERPWGRGEVRRLIGTGAGLIFKGSGFYITDYRSDSYRQAAKKDSDSKPAPPAEPASKPAASGSSGSTGPAKSEPGSKKSAE